MTAQSVMKRLEETVRGEGVHRIRDILSAPFRGRHITNFVQGNRTVDGIPLFDAMVLWGIRQEGLRISKGGATAKYGDGAYCLVGNAVPPSKGHYYVDIEIPATIGVEQIAIPGISYYYYRFLPAEGDVIHGVKIVGTNLSSDALDMAQRFMANR